MVMGTFICLVPNFVLNICYLVIGGVKKMCIQLIEHCPERLSLPILELL